MSSDVDARASVTEHTPLLRDNASDPYLQDEQEPTAEEPTTKELILILSSIWLGVFLAALGMLGPFPHLTLRDKCTNEWACLQTRPLLQPYPPPSRLPSIPSRYFLG